MEFLEAGFYIMTGSWFTLVVIVYWATHHGPKPKD
jgi:hypothetical protein